MEDEKGSFHFKKKWNIDEAVKKVTLAVYRYDGFDKYEVRDGWYSLRAYIGTLEIELKNAQEKLNGNSKAEAAQPLHR